MYVTGRRRHVRAYKVYSWSARREKIDLDMSVRLSVMSRQRFSDTIITTIVLVYFVQDLLIRCFSGHWSYFRCIPIAPSGIATFRYLWWDAFWYLSILLGAEWSLSYTSKRKCLSQTLSPRKFGCQPQPLRSAIWGQPVVMPFMIRTYYSRDYIWNSKSSITSNTA